MSHPAPDNFILAALPESIYERLLPHLQPVSLTQGQILHEQKEKITEVYFPTQALVSLISIQSDQLKAEIAMVGKQGVVGIPLFLEDGWTTTRAMVQLSGSALKLDAAIFTAEWEQEEKLRRVLRRYTQALLNQITHNGVCQANYSVEERLACLLLLAHNYSQRETLFWTQEFISNMMNTRRASITKAVSRLSQAGTIRSSRGQITILNRQTLASLACSPCVHIVKEDARLLEHR